MNFRLGLVGLVVVVALAWPALGTAQELQFSTKGLKDKNGPSCYRKLFCIHIAETSRFVRTWAEVFSDTPITFSLRTTHKGMSGLTRVGPIRFSKSGIYPLADLRWLSGEKASYYFKWSYHPGLIGQADIDETAVYELPFAPGRSYRVSQGQKTDNTHKRGEVYAVDWALDVGDAIHAARGGVVAGAGGWSGSRKRGRGNFIWIRHEDNTYAWYLHLKKGGVLVERGQRVKTGQLIGYSGNTGKTSGPHLHFQVSIPSSGKYAFQTIPFQLRTADGVIKRIRTGDRHRRPR